MAHSSIGIRSGSAHPGESTALEAEKLGVMAGFVAGLPFGLGLVHDLVLSQGLPTWLADGSAVAAVAATTWLGLRLGTGVAAWARRRG